MFKKINKWNKQPQQKRAMMNIKGVSSWEIDCQGNAIEAYKISIFNS